MTEEKPRIKGEGEKFVQLYINGEPYIRFGECYHNEILITTLNEFGLDFVPAIFLPVEGENYKAVGMGRVKREGQRCLLWGHSFKYKIGPSKTHLEDMIPHLPEDIKIEIEEKGK